MARILIIEDNEQNLYLAGFILRKHGHDIVEARDGREGIAVAAAAQPHLILLDIQLPIMDGYAVAAALRRMPSLDTVPIVGVTRTQWSAIASGSSRRVATVTSKSPSTPRPSPMNWRRFSESRLEETHEDGAHRR